MKPGDKIICISQGRWVFTRKPMGFWQSLFAKFRHGYGPKYNEIVTIEDIVDGYLRLCEYQLTDKDGARYSFNPDHFSPLISDSVLSEELASISEPVTV